MEQTFDEREVRDSECLAYYSRKVERFSGFFFFIVFCKLLIEKKEETNGFFFLLIIVKST